MHDFNNKYILYILLQFNLLNAKWISIFKNRGGEITKMNFLNIMVVVFSKNRIIIEIPKYF